MDERAVFDLRCRLDAETRRADAAERENAQLQKLLAYAEEAIMSEYRLRVSAGAATNGTD